MGEPFASIICPYYLLLILPFLDTDDAPPTGCCCCCHFILSQLLEAFTGTMSTSPSPDPSSSAATGGDSEQHEPVNPANVVLAAAQLAAQDRQDEEDEEEENNKKQANEEEDDLFSTSSEEEEEGNTPQRPPEEGEEPESMDVDDAEEEDDIHNSNRKKRSNDEMMEDEDETKQERYEEEEQQQQQQLERAINATSTTTDNNNRGECKDPSEGNEEEEPKENEDEQDGSEEDDDEEEEEEEDDKPSYSTRGRATQQDQQQQQPGSALDRLAAVGDLLSIGGSATSKTEISNILQSPETRLRESFLSDSLTEEERRTRTRYLPVVEGMHALRKLEVKGDLALARSTASSNDNNKGGGGNKSSKRKQRSSDDETAATTGMMQLPDLSSSSGGPSNNSAGVLYEADAAGEGLSGDEPLLEATRGGVKTVTVAGVELAIPSTAFVAPPPPESSSSAAGKRPSPREVEAVTAFNPPRPPESVGAKKKHRMLRWERRPADIEVDLSNYRKTVERTREEWMSAEAERDRIVVTDNHLRRHFLHHWQALHDELGRVGRAYAAVTQQCVEAADLPSSRTRTRGAFQNKGGASTAMRDVLYALRAKGKELENATQGLSSMMSGSSSDKAAVPKQQLGVGGVPAVSFQDWDRDTDIEPGKLASAWIVPGDTVETPYGPGTAVAVYGPGALDVSATPSPDLFPKKKAASAEAATDAPNKEGDAMEVDGINEPATAATQVTAATKKPAPSPQASPPKKEDANDRESVSHMLAPRVAVRLPFGVAFFKLDSVVSKEDPSAYSDERMAQRWKGLVETATTVGGTVDVAAAMTPFSLSREEGTTDGDAEAVPMDLETPAGVEAKDESPSRETARLLPFGSGLLPTLVGRGTNLNKASLAELDQEIEKAFYKGGGVMGLRDNVGVPRRVREREDQRQKNIILQAQVLQLRNQLYRQRRTRMLNERTYAATQERASRVESLVSEMRTDLKSLKGRLDQEIRDLGISEEQAENILTSFYMSLDSQHQGEASPPKRPRRTSRLDEEGEQAGFETGEDDEELGVPPVDFGGAPSAAVAAPGDMMETEAPAAFSEQQ